MKGNITNKESKLINKIQNDKNSAKLIHKALKRKLKKWCNTEKSYLIKAKFKNEEISSIQIHYIKYDWKDHSSEVYIYGNHKNRFCKENTYEFLEFSSYPTIGTTRLRGMIEVQIKSIIANTIFRGRSFCIWTDPFDLLLGTILAEYRLLRILKDYTNIYMLDEFKAKYNLKDQENED